MRLAFKGVNEGVRDHLQLFQDNNSKSQENLTARDYIHRPFYISSLSHSVIRLTRGPGIPSHDWKDNSFTMLFTLLTPTKPKKSTGLFSSNTLSSSSSQCFALSPRSSSSYNISSYLSSSYAHAHAASISFSSEGNLYRVANFSCFDKNTEVTFHSPVITQVSPSEPELRSPRHSRDNNNYYYNTDNSSTCADAGTDDELDELAVAVAVKSAAPAHNRRRRSKSSDIIMAGTDSSDDTPQWTREEDAIICARKAEDKSYVAYFINHYYSNLNGHPLEGGSRKRAVLIT